MRAVMLRFIVLPWALLAVLAARAPAAEDVWLDVDTSIGLPRGEVDDGLALIQAFHSPEMTIRGISVVFGNTTLEKAVPIARELTRRFGPEGIGVSPGASRADQLGEETEACASWIEMWRERFGVDGFDPFDTLGVGWVSHPQLIRGVEVGVWIEEGEDDRRPGETKPYLLVDPDREGRRALYLHTPEDGFPPLVLERLSARP